MCVIVSQLPGVAAFKGMYHLTFRVVVNKLLDRNDLRWDVFILAHRIIGLPVSIGGKT